METAPRLRRLRIERFRGIKELIWHPGPCVNVILGGGDVGKTTILDALALLLHPTNTASVTDADYWLRNCEQGFVIEAVFSLPATVGMSRQSQITWPWYWDGKDLQLPHGSDENATDHNSSLEAVYVLRLRGTPEFDLAYEIVQPNGDADHLSVATRRSIGLVRLGGDDKNDRDLRLVQGSALDRLLSDTSLRARVGKSLDKNNVESDLQDEAREKLRALNVAFINRALPEHLSLGITGGPGLSVSALIGLTAAKEDVQLPLMNWGAGTRRLAALEIAASQQGETPITIVDEIERGLEPYRQRILLKRLLRGQSQSFVTTHSAAALAAAASANIWYVDSEGSISELPATANTQRKVDPETFLAKVAIVAEGKTEIGFVSELLSRTLTTDYLEHGIWITDGGGNERSLALIEDLAKCGLNFGGFVDNDGKFPTKWASAKSTLGSSLFQWSEGCTEENIIRLVPKDRLEEFIQDPNEELTSYRLRTLADRLGLGKDKSFASILTAASDLHGVIIDAALGRVPTGTTSPAKEYKAHASSWFKSEKGGRELLGKVSAFGLGKALEPQLLPFVNGVRSAVGLGAISTLGL